MKKRLYKTAIPKRLCKVLNVFCNLSLHALYLNPTRVALLSMGLSWMLLSTGCKPWCSQAEEKRIDALAQQFFNGTKTPSPKGTFSLITFNTYRLKSKERALQQFQLLKHLGKSLQESEKSPLPDIILLQELTQKEAIQQLKASFQPTHHFASFHCDPDLSSGGIVGAAVKKSAFKMLSPISHIPLGGTKLLFDHQRCAVHLHLQDKQNAKAPALHILGVHLSFLTSARRVAQTKKLLNALKKKKTPKEHIVIAGDFNFRHAEPGYKLFSNSLRDAFPNKKGTTHFNGRFDHVFLGKKMALLKCLSCQAAERVLLEGLSDHLPEGGIFGYKP